MQEQKWFEVSIGKTGFTARKTYKPTFQRDLARKVLVLDSKVYASNEVLSALVETQWLVGPYVQFGRRKMYQVNSTVLDEARARCEYRRYKQTDYSDTQLRNLEIIAWFDSFVADARGKLVTCLTTAKGPNGDEEPLTVDDANWLIDNANQFTDEELGEMVGAKAASAFRKLLTWL